MEITRNTVVQYDDPSHTYSLNGKQYLSASQIVGLFSQPFDGPAVAARYAAENGFTPEYWLAKWEEKKNKSLVRGNTIHDANDLSLNARMIDVIDGEVIPVRGDIYDDSYPWYQRPDGVYTERMLWHHGYNIAGRSDKVVRRTHHHKLPLDNSQAAHIVRLADVEDYKTNEKLEFVSYRFRNGRYKMMLEPLSHVMDCNMAHYTLQLSLYMFMLEYQGFEPGRMYIKHYPHPTEENPNPKPVYHNLTYMKREVIAMLNHINATHGV